MSTLVYGSQSIDLVHLPKAHGEAVFAGVYRTEVSDFVVTEDLGFELAGTGPHLWALIRKRGISTEEATSRLAQVSKTSRKDLGCAGKKDTHAVATQWISLPETAVIEEGVIDESLEVLRLTRNQRKLRIGQLAGNRFEIRLHGSTVGDFEERIKLIATEGVPNYFGPQRFGRSGSNLETARCLARRDPTGRRQLHPKDGMAASAARSAGFNAVVAARLRQSRWLEVKMGDAVALAGRGSHFMVSDSELEAVRDRIVTGDLDPTAPMAGRQTKTSIEQAAFECSILKIDPELFTWMTGVFRDEERRAVRFLPKQLEAEGSGHTLELSFWLPKGSFATTLFNELGNLQEAHARAAL